MTFYPATNDSGSLGDYTNNGSKTSTDATFISAATNGVWMFGDSITVADSKDFATRLSAAGGGYTAVYCQGGAPTRHVLDFAVAKKNQLSLQPQIIVMAAGTNDIFNPEIMTSQIQRTRNEFPSSKILWVTTWVQRWSYSQDIQFADSRNSGRVNGAILDSGVDAVVDWGRFLANKPGRDKMYLRDGVHTTDGIGEAYSGQGARNQLIVDAALRLN